MQELRQVHVSNLVDMLPAQQPAVGVGVDFFNQVVSHMDHPAFIFILSRRRGPFLQQRANPRIPPALLRYHEKKNPLHDITALFRADITQGQYRRTVPLQW